MIKNRIQQKNIHLQSQKATNSNTNSRGFLLNSLDKDYQELKQEISSFLTQEPKPIQIRVKEWLKKFETVAQVELWKKNRNLYAKVLCIMLKNKILNHPFHKLPPSSSLSMLSLYEISFDVRKQLEKQSSNLHNDLNSNGIEQQKENLSQFSNKMSQENCLTHQRSKQRYSIQSKIIHKQTQQVSEMQERQSIDREISQKIRSSYDFLLKNIEKFSKKEQALKLLQELWNFETLR